MDYRVDSPEELAAAFRTQLDLGLGGMLVCNPIPEQYAMEPARVQHVIEQALAECEAQGIHGKDITPFLLARVCELTGGDSLSANIELVLNNVRLAAQTAACL